MLRNSKPVAFADTRNWSALLARSGHVSVFLTQNFLPAVAHLLLRYRYGQVDRENLSISVAFVEKAF
jgi:hypothetical protein